MVVCSCHGVSDKEIKRIVSEGAQTVRDVRRSCKAGSDCGICVCQVKELIEEHKSVAQDQSRADEEI